MTSGDRASDAPGQGPAAGPDSDTLREQIQTAAARSVLDAAARRLSDAVAAFEEALDRQPLMSELQFLDREVAQAERDHAAARRSVSATGDAAPRRDTTVGDATAPPR